MLPHLRLFRNDFSLSVHARRGRTGTGGRPRMGRARLGMLVVRALCRAGHLRRSAARAPRALATDDTQATTVTVQPGETATTISCMSGMTSPGAGGQRI